MVIHRFLLPWVTVVRYSFPSGNLISSPRAADCAHIAATMVSPLSSTIQLAMKKKADNAS